MHDTLRQSNNLLLGDVHILYIDSKFSWKVISSRPQERILLYGTIKIDRDHWTLIPQPKQVALRAFRTVRTTLTTL